MSVLQYAYVIGEIVILIAIFPIQILVLLYLTNL